MNKSNLLVRYDKDLRLRIMYPEARKEITSDVVRIIRRAPGTNVVSFTFANERSLHKVIHNELEYFLPLQQPLKWRVYDHDLLPSLKEELVAHGFAKEDSPTHVMVLDLKKSPALLSQPVEEDIRRIETSDGLRDIIHVLERVWGGRNDRLHDRLAEHLQIPGYASVYAAYVAGNPASIAWTHFPRGQFAKLSGGSTIAEYRRQGLYTSLLATRLREIHERGYRFAVTETNQRSQPFLEKHGFLHLTTVQEFKWNGN